MLFFFFLATLHSNWDFPNQGRNPCPLHWTLKSLNHQESQEMFTFNSLVQSRTRVQTVTPCTPAHQDSLSITNSQSLPKLLPIESVMP